MLGWVMLTWTIRWTPARLAARNRVRELATASSWSIRPMGEAHPVGVVEGGGTSQGLDQTELVVEVQRADLDVGSSPPRSGWPVMVRTLRPLASRARAMAAPE